MLKDFDKFKELYHVYTNGDIYSVRRDRLLTPRVGQYGYASVILCNNGFRRQYKVHRLIAELYIENPEELKEINHINGDKLDNRIENLEWSTRSRNIKHAYDLGLKDIKGSKHGRSKLTEEDIYVILQKIEEGIMLKDIALSYCVSPGTISHIKNNRIWKHCRSNPENPDTEGLSKV